jgi:hypothetical protein
MLSVRETMPMTNFERLLIATVREYRNRCQGTPVRHLHIEISAEGRIDGDLKITYHCRNHYDTNVSGNTLEDVFVELLRRNGWAERHQPLCLPNVEGGDVHGDDVEG